MAVVQSFGALVPTGPGPFPVVTSPGFVHLPAVDRTPVYEAIYRTQPNVRTVVSFLGRNIAQLGLHVYRRVSDTDRVRLTDHPFALTLTNPTPDTTGYELIDALVNDLGIWDQAFWVKARRPDSDALSLLRVPPRHVEVTKDGLGQATAYRVFDKLLQPGQVVHFRGYSPTIDRDGTSPIETLARLLDEDIAASDYREQFWRTGARVSTVIKRPAGTPWSDLARERFRSEWQDVYAGHGPGAGGTPLLEDGMEVQSVGFNAEQSQYLEARKLTREEVAAAYHIPPPMVGILDRATFSNVTEQHKNLYQDTLGPWLQMIAQRIDLQLLSEFDDRDGVYCEFNLAEKMRGSFEEQATAMQTAVGAPWLTRNEARARLNLPSVDGGDELVTPLNVLIGGQASPTDADTTALARAAGGTKVRPEDRWAQRFAAVFRRHFASQRDVVLGAATTGVPLAVTIADEQWDRQLADELFDLNEQVTAAVARKIVRQAGIDPRSVDLGRFRRYLRANADAVASVTNASTASAIEGVVAQPDDDVVAGISDLFAGYIEGRANMLGTTQATEVSGYAGTTAATQVGLNSKTWVVTSGNPRPSHAAIDGETVPVGDTFSNGLRWPGDGAGDTDETAGCTCDLTYQTEERA